MKYLFSTYYSSNRWLWLIILSGFVVLLTTVSSFVVGIAAIPIEQRMQSFGTWDEQARYTIRLCADLPVNERPDKVHYQDEPGHVFLILSKEYPDRAQKPVHQVFGFHPRTASSAISFAFVKSEIRDNGERPYEAFVQQWLNAEKFRMVQELAVTMSKKKYHLNHFNCYDYAMNVYNGIAGIDSIPRSIVKFPFIYGKGGSPCGLYKDLKQLVYSDSLRWQSSVKFGNFIAPVSTK